MTTTKRSQIDIIREHLEAGKSITPLHAQMVYGISRLSSIIERLRNRGMDILTTVKEDEAGHKYSEYRLCTEGIQVGDAVRVRRGYGTGLPYRLRRAKQAKVVGLYKDSAMVEMFDGRKHEVVLLNKRELCHG